jgi:hypothetical protein
VSDQKHDAEDLFGAGIVIYDMGAATSMPVRLTKGDLSCISTSAQAPCLFVGGGKW